MSGPVLETKGKDRAGHPLATQRLVVGSAAVRTCLVPLAICLGLAGPARASGPEPLGEPFVVNTITFLAQTNPAIAMSSNGQSVVAWTDQFNPDVITGQRFAADGSFLGEQFAIGDSGDHARVAMAEDNSFVVVWQGGGPSQGSSAPLVRGRRFNSNGELLGEAFDVGSGLDQGHPDVAMTPDGRFVVVWESIDNSNFGNTLFRRRYDVSGAALEEPVVITGSSPQSHSPKVGIDKQGRFVVLWRSGASNGYRFAWDGTPLGPLDPQGSFALDQVDVSADGRLVAGSGSRIEFFDFDGMPLIPPVEVDSPFGTHSTFDVGPDGDFVVVWQALNLSTVRGRAFRAEGIPRGSTFEVGPVIAQGYPPDVALDGHGNFMMVWESGHYLSDGPDGSAHTIMGRRFRLPGPEVSIAEGILALHDHEVFVPVELSTAGETLAAVGLSVDYEAGCLSFEEADLDGDGLPDGLDVSTVPPGYQVIAFHDLGDADGELDLIVSGAPPAAPLADGPLVGLRFTATCQPPADQSTVAPVLFSTDPAPSFSDEEANDVPGTAQGGSVQIFDGRRGDCNGDDSLSVADFLATELEIFDGDGSFWLDTPNPTFVGSPVGCDANGDTTIDAGDITCTGLLIFGLGPCGGGAAAAASAPRLTIEGPMGVGDDGRVRVALHFRGRGSGAHAVAFSFDLGPGLAFVEGSLVAHIPVARSYLANDPDDRAGEIDLLLADAPGEAPWPDGVLLELELQLTDSGLDRTWIRLAESPTASYGTVSGTGGSAETGSRPVSIIPGLLFGDGFESGTADRWSLRVP